MTRGGSWSLAVLMSVLALITEKANAEVIAAADLAARQQWVQSHLVETRPSIKPLTELQIWASHDGLLRNGRAGRPLNIAGKEYKRGLLAHAPSKVAVQLDSPGRTFSATVGLDSNEQTRPGLGSVVFSVTVGDKVAFQSGVLREGMKGVPVDVDLGGATSFVLEVGNAGDGISCDHADWAEAKVVLANGRELSLGDVPEARPGNGLPFSFTYGGTPSKWLLSSWERKEETTLLDANRKRRTTSWTDPKTNLEVCCESIEYTDFPVVEWTIHFHNRGRVATPILQDIRALDLRIEKTPKGEVVLHGCKGDFCTPDSYQPFALPLRSGANHTFAPPGGRPTEMVFPYYNLSMSDGGLIVALG